MAERIEEGKRPILVNVLGTDGSGTTMLGLMLANSETGFACGEARIWYRPWRPAHFRAACWCGQDPCPVWNRIGVFPEADFHRRVVDQLGARVVTDSSKWLDWARDSAIWARERDMTVANVLIWKEPFELSFTWWRRHFKERYGNAKRLNARLVAELTRKFVGYHRTVVESDLSPLVVSYAHLMDDPQNTLVSLCGAMEIECGLEQHLFWEKRHHTLFGNQTAKRTLSGEKEPTLERSKPSPEYLDATDGLTEQLEQHAEIQRMLDRLRDASLSPAVEARA